jgi:alkyl hydroperoxide reductase subunit F
MLDNDLKMQLRELFRKLNWPIEIRLFKTNHSVASELDQFLSEVVSCSDQLSLTRLNDTAPAPYFQLWSQSKFTGVAFTGIPSGHEFSSFILALLNATEAGQLPDKRLRSRMELLKREVEVRTFVSLSCENCPDVVQALNQVALFGRRIKHTMVEGSVVEDELSRLNIQGVPAVFVGDKLIHSGRGGMSELLEKLENELGSETSVSSIPESLGTFDVAVLGGGPAGVSAAIYSARKGLRTALIAEKIGGQVNETKGIENLISVIYTDGPKLSAGLAEHIRSYPVSIFEQRKLKKLTSGEKKSLLLDSGETLDADQIIVATGAKWRTLDVPGEVEYLGRGVAYCPHCDGPFFKEKAVAVIGGGNSGVEAAIDLAGICSSVTVVEFAESLKADQVLLDKLNSLKNVSVLKSSKTTRVLGNGSKVIALELEDRNSHELRTIAVDGVFVQIGLIPNSECVKGAVELSSSGEIEVDHKGRTSLKGVYAAGDVTTTPYKQIIIAMGEGAKVALSAFEDRTRSF